MEWTSVTANSVLRTVSLLCIAGGERVSHVCTDEKSADQVTLMFVDWQCSN